ncbi:MAG TPA: RnfABCDGE type electron transport complex subunit D [Phycisphaerae bacterium]|nr:RnfABCDGE type electron transport complex subunit D [Phycisphaerales bacterium]HRX84790.1 RnfABCDGE type electron transport complex subunit D [Phycisphaerae bacterium]
MTSAPDIPLVTAPPHVRLGPHRRHLDRTLLAGLAPVIAVALWWHGGRAALLFGIAGAAGLLGDWAGHFLHRHRRQSRAAHALTIGFLLVMILPPATSATAIGVATAVAAFCSRVLRDRFGSYFWHPVVVAWMIVLLVAPRVPRTGEGVAAVERPIDLVVRAYVAPPEGGVRRLRNLALYELPPWDATLIGDVPGGTGATCGLAILVAGLWLVYVRNLRWQVPVYALGAAALAAAVLPVRGPEGAWLWLPIAQRIDGFPIGMTLLLYHLTGGGLLLAAVFLGADTISTPLNARGHALFGVGLGAGTVLLRMLGLPFGACWWALLVMNTLVPVIDRVTRRRVWGT